MSELTCRLIASIPEGTRLNRVLARHKATCPRCTADDQRTAGVTHELSSLGGETLRAPDGLATSVMTRLGNQDGADPRRSLVVRLIIRWAATGVVLLATAVAVIAGISARMRRSGAA